MTQQATIDRLQMLLLVGRLPEEYAELHRAAEPARDVAALACALYAGMGIGWPLPCLAKGWTGDWHSVVDLGAS